MPETWFVGVVGPRSDRPQRIRQAYRLITAPARQISTTAGVRLLDRKLVGVGALDCVREAQDQICRMNYETTNAYDLVNVYLGYSPTPDVTASFSIDNLLDAYYCPTGAQKHGDRCPI